jgi:hypothetical protein
MIRVPEGWKGRSDTNFEEGLSMIAKHIATIGLVGIIGTLTGCAAAPETRSSQGFGDAVRANIAAQVVVPDEELDGLPGPGALTGQQAEQALERLRNAPAQVGRQPIVRGMMQ